jgi:ABC-type transporter Mla subunit MlaD
MLEMAISARYRAYQRAVGLLMLVTLAVLLAMLWMANRQFGFFTQTYRLYGFTDNVKNLERTTPVTLAGLKIGVVRDLTITDYNQIRVELLLDRIYQPRVRGDSTALVKADLLGSAQIEITMGAPEQPMLGDGAVIAVARSPDLDVLLRQAQEQLGQVAAVLTNVKILTDELKKPDGALLGALSAFTRLIQDFSTRLSVTLERLDDVLQATTALGGQMSQSAADLAAVSARIRQGQGALGGLTDSTRPLSRQIAASVQKLETVLAHVEKLTRQAPAYGHRLERILRHTEHLTERLAEASHHAPGLLDQGRAVVENVNETVGAVRDSALFRALDPSSPTRLPPDAPRDAGWPMPAAAR